MSKSPPIVLRTNIGYLNARRILRRCLKTGQAFFLRIQTIDGRQFDDYGLHYANDLGIGVSAAGSTQIIEFPWWELLQFQIEWA
jgi:hypothetical protein